MYIHDSTIKYLKQSEGLIFKSQLNVVGFFYAIILIAWADLFLPVITERFTLFRVLLVVSIVVLWGYILWNEPRNYIKLLEDGFELSTTEWLGFKTIREKYNWKDIEKLDVLRSDKYEYLIIKERNKAKEFDCDITSFSNGVPTLESVIPLGCSLSLEDYINYIDLLAKDDSFTKFTLDKYERAPTVENACCFILNMVCKLNPAARSSQAKILAAERKYQLLTDFSYEDDIKGVAHAAGVLRKWERADKQRFVELLFRLVITDDGIKNDEWYFMQRLIADLGFNQHWLDYFNRRYSSLRTEFDYKYNEQSSPSSSSFASSLQPYYNLLGLPAGASISQLQAAYHQLAMENHPDLPKNANRTAECEKTMTKINEAYEVLVRNLKH